MRGLRNNTMGQAWRCRRNALRLLLLLEFAFSCLGCLAAEGKLYHHFLSLVDTNDPTPKSVTSPLLVDPGNTAPNLRTNILDLEKLKQEDGIAGIRLGMTMDEVLAQWGKPRWLWSRCVEHLPTLVYSDVRLAFEGSSLKVIWCNMHEDTRFANGLSNHSPIKRWVEALGRPSARTGSDAAGLVTYSGPKSTMTLQFHNEEMCTIRLERPRN